MEVAILEVEELQTLVAQLSRFDGGRGAIVGMDELHVGPRQQLGLGPPQHAFPCRIDALEVAVEAGDHEHVEAEREEAVELVLGAPAIDEHADLAADGRQHREQIGVGRADLAAEELHHAEHFAAQQDREPERRVEAFARRDRRAREIPVLRHVGNPDRLAAGPHPAGQPDAPREGRRAADGVELGKRAGLRRENLGTAQDVVLAIDVPERAVLPVERAADGFEDARHGLGERRGLDERAGHHMLGPEASLGQPVAAQHVNLLCHGEAWIIARLQTGGRKRQKDTFPFAMKR